VEPSGATGLGPGPAAWAPAIRARMSTHGCVSTSEDQARLAREWVKWLRSQGCVSLKPRSCQEMAIAGARESQPAAGDTVGSGGLWG